MAKYITSDLKDGVGRVGLNRAEKRNALTLELLNELRDAVRSLSSNRALRVLVLQAAGPVFCSGMDLTQMRDRAMSPQQDELWRKDSKAYHDVLLTLIDCRVPTLAALAGPAIAGGVGLVLACDIIIASDSAFYSLPEPRRGIAAALVTPLLLRRMSPAKAGYLLLSGKRIASGEARAIGLCDEVVAQPEFDAAVQAMIDSVLQSSPQALATTKQFLHSANHDELRAALQQAIDVSAQARATDDAREGLQAFLEKRDPTWVQRIGRHDPD